MSAAPRTYPSLTQHLRWCRNGSIPDKAFQQRLADGLNHVLAYRRKTFFTVGTDFTGASSGMGTSDSTTNYWYAYCRTGHAATQLRFRLLIGMALTPGEFPVADDPITRINVNGTDYDVNYGTTDSGEDPTDAPNQLYSCRVDIPCSPLTNYEVKISGVDAARPLACTAYEYADPTVDATDYFARIRAGARKPITAADREDLLVGLTETWRSNGAPLIAWVGNGQGSSHGQTGTTWRNIIDQSSTSVSATSPGWSFDDGSDAAQDLRKHIRLKDQTADSFPVTMAVYGGSTTGQPGVGEVRVQSAAGTHCSVTNIEADGWYTSDTTWADATGASKFDIQCRNTNASWSVGIWAVFVYPRAG